MRPLPVKNSIPERFGLWPMASPADAGRYEHKDNRDRVEAVIAAHLSLAHRDSAERGCAMAALAAEASRLDSPTRQAIGGSVVRFAWPPCLPPTADDDDCEEPS